MVQPAELSAGAVPVVATFIVKNEHVDEFSSLAGQLIPLVRQEPGCLMYMLSKAVEQPDPEHTKLMFVELYTDEAALQAHLSRPEVQQAISGCADWLKEGTSPLIEQLTTVA